MRSLVFGLALLLASCGESAPAPDARIFVAVEGDGVVAALDEAGALLRLVDLSDHASHRHVRYWPHNVQGAPDGRMVWATAHPGAHHEAQAPAGVPDQLIGVDVGRLAVTRRIPLGEGVHAAHVVIGGGRAWVTAYASDEVIEVDLAAGRVARRLVLAPGTGPHGARLTPDGSTLLVAGMGLPGTLVAIDTTTGDRVVHALPAPAVQIAVHPAGAAAWATLLGSRQLTRLDLALGAVTLLDLPHDVAGPVQLYPTPDGSALWLADQGLLLPGGMGYRALEVDGWTGAVLRAVEVGDGPHGVVVAPGGATVWVTSAAAGLVQSIDAKSGTVRSSTPVGAMPNGITCVHPGGAMP